MSAKDFVVYRSFGDGHKDPKIETPVHILLGMQVVCEWLFDYLSEHKSEFETGRVARHYVSAIKKHLSLLSLSLKFLAAILEKGDPNGKTEPS